MPQLAPLGFSFISDQNGFVSGGRLWTYDAGTSTPKATWTDATGATANSNPVVGDATGKMRVWLADNETYKLRYEDASGSLLWEVDQVTGVGSAAGQPAPAPASEWVQQADTPVFVSASSFTVAGDQTAIYHVGRRLRAQVTGGVSYSTILTSAFAAGNTTVTVDVTQGPPLDAGISILFVGINSADNPSISVECVQGIGSLFTIQPGMFVPYAGSAAIAGYVLADGAQYDGTDPTYTPLWNVIGTTYGGTGQAAFNVPDMRNRSPVGFGQLDGTGAAASIGVKQGAETMLLLDANLPTTTMRDPTVDRAVGGVGGLDAADNVNTTFGGDTPFNLRAPELPINWLIKL